MKRSLSPATRWETNEGWGMEQEEAEQDGNPTEICPDNSGVESDS